MHSSEQDLAEEIMGSIISILEKHSDETAHVWVISMSKGMVEFEEGELGNSDENVAMPVDV